MIPPLHLHTLAARLVVVTTAGLLLHTRSVRLRLADSPLVLQDDVQDVHLRRFGRSRVCSDPYRPWPCVRWPRCAHAHRVRTCLFVKVESNVQPSQQSALLALATALPPSVLAQAATNQAGFASEIASSLAAGSTPEWYQALPTDVKSALASIYPVQTPAQTTPAETSSPSPSSSPSSSSTEEVTVTEVSTSAEATITEVSTSVVVVPSGTGASGIGNNGTAVTSINKPTLSSSGAETGSPQPTEQPGAASIPSAAIGAGIAGAIAFIGMLAL